MNAPFDRYEAGGPAPDLRESASLLVLLAGGCSLKKSSSGDCTTDPGMTGGGTAVCTKPPPSQFTELNQ